MRHCLIFCALLLGGCGTEPPPLAMLDLTPCPGWTAAAPTSERQFARAASAERAGRLCANAKLAAVQALAG